MPESAVHIQASVKRTGREYREVHEWIDNPATKYERHDFSRVLENARMFTEQYGEEAAQEYVMHLVDDMHCRFNKVLDENQKLTADCLKYFGA
jgi:hypothetical protein